MLGVVKRQGHVAHVSPVVVTELLERVVVVFFEVGRVAGLAVIQEPQLVVPEQREPGVQAGQGDDLGTVGAAVDQIAEQDDPVVSGQLELLKQLLEFAVAAVDVPDGNEATLHEIAGIWLAFTFRRAKHKAPWN